MLAVDWQYRRHPTSPLPRVISCAGRDQRFLVGQRNRPSRFDRRHHRFQAGAADDRGHHPVGVARRGFGQRISACRRAAFACFKPGHELRQQRRVIDDREPRAGPQRRISECGNIPCRSQGDHLDTFAGWRSIRSRVDVPTEPVAPRIEIRRRIIARPRSLGRRSGQRPAPSRRAGRAGRHGRAARSRYPSRRHAVSGRFRTGRPAAP